MRRAILALGCGALLGAAPRVIAQSAPRTWTADNGNGTFSNPLFYDEFDDSCRAVGFGRQRTAR